MDTQQVSHKAIDPGRRACQVEGCPCKDPRIVSKRRATFYAAVARDHGETADRVVAPDPSWRMPDLSSAAA